MDAHRARPAHDVRPGEDLPYPSLNQDLPGLWTKISKSGSLGNKPGILRHDGYRRLMLIKAAPNIRTSEITPKHLYLNRRRFLAGLPVAGAALLAGRALAGAKIDGVAKSAFSTSEKVTPFNDVTHYNNYYEF